MNFCIICESRLKEITTDTKLYFKCSKCEETYDSTPENTKMYEESFNKKNSMLKYRTFLRNAAFDNTNPIEKRKCPKCPREEVRYAIIGSKKKYIYVCECGHMF
jgi:DNA-directed RNA polymerase subunit M/transcription elongation factor TFIIS